MTKMILEIILMKRLRQISHRITHFSREESRFTGEAIVIKKLEYIWGNLVQKKNACSSKNSSLQKIHMNQKPATTR